MTILNNTPKLKSYIYMQQIKLKEEVDAIAKTLLSPDFIIQKHNNIKPNNRTEIEEDIDLIDEGINDIGF